MIQALKSDDLITKAGGRFKLCTLIQRRLAQLMDGARPLVERNGRSDLELVMEEILHDKISLGWLQDSQTSEDENPAAADAPLL